MTRIKRLISVAIGTLSPLLLKNTTRRSVGAMLENQARKRPEQALLLFEGRTVTYRQANERANRYAHLFMSLGFRKGDTVALFMENRPEYLIIHAGLAKVGIVPALINTNNRGQVLVHAITVVDAKAVICGSELVDRFLGIAGELKDTSIKHRFIEKETRDIETPGIMTDLHAVLDKQPVTEPVVADPIVLGDTLEYIYTSGTTGHPKATILTHKKWFQLGYALGGMSMEAIDEDIQYMCLPLYHNSGINIAWPITLMWGGTMALRRKFSASKFWDDVRAYKANRFVYIGELCRYLNNAPVKDDDGNNPLEVILGNGMRAEYWQQFQKRFAIKRIVEVYGATEGVGGLINKKGVPGMIGCLTLFGIVKMGEVARYDPDTDTLIRDAKGFAIPCKPGQNGMFLSRIGLINQFSGYKNNPKATKAKLLTDVFKKGDAYFVSGDLFKLHDKGYVSFVDRLGDTFKWKGEVVSTNEVADVLFQFKGIDDANVYGVEVQGAEGRTGMAALTLTPGTDLDLDGLARYVSDHLAAYAVPRMVRILEQSHVTATFKQVKIQLKKEGFDPSVIKDPLYFLHPDNQRYVELTPELFASIQSGRIRF